MFSPLQAVQQAGNRRVLTGVHRQSQHQQLLRAEGFFSLVRSGERDVLGLSAQQAAHGLQGPLGASGGTEIGPCYVFHTIFPFPH